MAVNWAMGQAPDIGGTFMQAFDRGRAERKQENMQNALAAYATDPSDQKLNDLAPYNPQFVIQQRQAQAQQQQKQQEAAQKQMPIIHQMLKSVKGNPAMWQPTLQAAQRMGIKLDGVPPEYNEQWVDQSLAISKMFIEQPDKISGAAQEVKDLGHDLNTPEGRAVLASIINNKYASDYVDEAGNTRRRSVLNIQPMQQQPAQASQNPAEPAQSAVIDGNQYRGAVSSLGPQKAAEWAQRNGIRVKVMTPEEAMQLPSGTPLTLPDGSEGVVP